MSTKHLPLVGAFSCVEKVGEGNSKVRKRIRKHSQDMDKFLKECALHDQERGLSVTRLLIDKKAKKIMGYVSLCNDSIRLEIDERDTMQIEYATAPSIKIARLAVSNEYQGKGLGRLLIAMSTFIATEIGKNSGVVFITLDCYEDKGVTEMMTPGGKQNLLN